MVLIEAALPGLTIIFRKKSYIHILCMFRNVCTILSNHGHLSFFIFYYLIPLTEIPDGGLVFGRIVSHSCACSFLLFFFWIHSAACLVLFGTNNCWRSVGGNDWDIADGQECQRRCYLLRLLSWQKQEGANHWLTRDKQASFKQLCLMNRFQSEKDKSGIKHRRNHVNMWRDW